MKEPFYTVDRMEACRSVGFLLKRCSILVSQIAERRFAPEPISFTQWLVLAALGLDEHVSPTALSVATGFDMGALTRVVDGLQKKDLVRRGRSERDRRAVEITVTPNGRECLQNGRHVVVELLNLLVSPNSRQETETLIGLLRRMLKHLQETLARDSSRVQLATQTLRPRQPRRAKTGATT